MDDTIRLAVAEDVASVVAIDGNVNISPWPASRIQAICTETSTAKKQSQTQTDSTALYRVLVAESGQRIHGFIVVSWVLDEGEIQNLGVSPSHQGKGVGSMLLAAAMDLLQQQMARRCLLEVRSSNLRARSLYAKSGFVLDGVRKNYYQSDQGREDALLMSLDLNGERIERT